MDGDVKPKKAGSAEALLAVAELLRQWAQERNRQGQAGMGEEG